MQTLETTRLIIRDFTADDAAALQAIFGDAETMRSCEPAYDLAKTCDFFSRSAWTSGARWRRSLSKRGR